MNKYLYKIGKYLLKDRPYLSDELQIKLVYHKRFGSFPNLKNPINFNEKNNWRKLHERNPIYTSMVDKFTIKQIIKERCGDGHSFKLLSVWDNPKDIDITNLPNQFVLKANHAGGIQVCKDKTAFDIKNAIKKMSEAYNEDYFNKNREWPYKNVQRKIIAEEYMGDNLTDYKNYCFNGKLVYTLVWKNISNSEGTKPQAYFCGAYDREWKKTDLKLGYPSLENEIIEKPKCYNQLVTLAEKMSKDIPFVRVDTYIIKDKVYIGEMTFYPWGGFQKFNDESWNEKLGNMIKIDNQ